MKKIILSLIMGLCIISGSSQAQQNNHADTDRLSRIKAAQTLRVCIWPDYYSITFRNPRTQTLEGIDIDMAYALANYLEAEVKFIDSSFALLAENLLQDNCDIAMHGIGVREDRAEYMDFSQPHLRSGIYAVGRNNDTHIQIWEDIDQPGNIVAVQQGTYMEPVMRERLQHAELAVVNDFMAREQEVMAGRADVFMTDYPYGLRMAALTNWARLIKPSEPFAPTDYAYAVPRNEPGWLNTINQFLNEVKTDGTLYALAVKHRLDPIVVLTVKH